MLSESLIYFNKNNLANFYIRKLQRIFPSCRFFENTRKKLLLNLVLVLVLVFYSKGLYCKTATTRSLRVHCNLCAFLCCPFVRRVISLFKFKV